MTWNTWKRSILQEMDLPGLKQGAKSLKKPKVE